MTSSLANLHVALALALGAQPAETDDELIARVYLLARRTIPARRPRGLDLSGRLALALTAPRDEADAALVDRVYRLARPRTVARRPRGRDTEPTLLDLAEVS